MATTTEAATRPRAEATLNIALVTPNASQLSRPMRPLARHRSLRPVPRRAGLAAAGGL